MQGLKINLAGFEFVPQNAIYRELCLRITAVKMMALYMALEHCAAHRNK